jgi:hypothetical protein
VKRRKRLEKTVAGSALWHIGFAAFIDIAWR